MINIFSKNQPVEFVSMHSDLRNWRFLGMEMESLGTRLDAARAALTLSNSDWARWYWTETIDRLMLQWSSLPIMHDGDATMTRMPRWTVDYGWWEGTQEPAYTGLDGIAGRVFDNIFRSENLDRIWDRHRDARLAKCNCY
jgi:hypothetical protein